MSKSARLSAAGLVGAAGAAVLTGALLLPTGGATAAPARPGSDTVASTAGAKAATQSARGQRVTSFAPVGRATLTPGIQAYTAGAQCTTNFVFTDAEGAVYLGYAAHCAGTGAATDTDGCTTKSLPLGTKVVFAEGGSTLADGTRLGTGTLAYSSWATMQRIGTTDAAACAYNDLALVKVDRKDLGKVNPSVPFFGGPTAIDTDGTGAGDTVFSYGNSSLRGGVSLLSPKFGLSLGDEAGGWTHSVYTLTPGVPGDSGSGFLSNGGRAVGVLSTLALAPLPLSNGVSDLSRALNFAQKNSGIPGLKLALGTKAFSAVGGR
ncbi:hypothetical protein [Nocardioides sp.]|uniref:hypothetical protein n=1 Tax=Nocardioides sp. TaxID=35761 RepID=UPI003512CFCB